MDISIHALLAESDSKPRRLKSRRCVFLSTLSLRRATVHYDNYNLHCVISIHALLAESDGKPNKLAGLKLVFLSTLSLRRATDTSSLMQCQAKFLSTLSLRRATDWPPVREIIQWISIHALLAESDPARPTANNATTIFLSTLSLRRATS